MISAPRSTPQASPAPVHTEKASVVSNGGSVCAPPIPQASASSPMVCQPAPARNSLVRDTARVGQSLARTRRARSVHKPIKMLTKL